jgi:hypothetical protein
MAKNPGAERLAEVSIHTGVIHIPFVLLEY